MFAICVTSPKAGRIQWVMAVKAYQCVWWDPGICDCKSHQSAERCEDLLAAMVVSEV